MAAAEASDVVIQNQPTKEGSMSQEERIQEVLDSNVAG
jgi:hypothetical protein